uniref:Uncharacterized protein n=1 Tax=Panagrolaimus sp. PS1159 TaxID=55785 RepID=A0AC35G0H4_9BILA
MPEPKCNYHLEPIPGMDLVRKNFEAIKDASNDLALAFSRMPSIKDASNDLALACSRMPCIPLSTRFMLLERGYLLVRDDKLSNNPDRKVYVGEAEVEGPIILQQE